LILSPSHRTTCQVGVPTMSVSFPYHLHSILYTTASSPDRLGLPHLTQLHALLSKSEMVNLTLFTFRRPSTGACIHAHMHTTHTQSSLPQVWWSGRSGGQHSNWPQTRRGRRRWSWRRPSRVRQRGAFPERYIYPLTTFTANF